MHPYDKYFYDPALGADDPIAGYTPLRYLADLRARFGGIDGLLLWPTYPHTGIDDRNQYDFFRSMPGGLAGLANVTAALHAAGVKVLLPYNPWDTGTRREAIWRHHGDDSDAKTLAAVLKQTGGDGFNGDTMESVAQSFWQAALDLKHPIAIEPEGGGADSALAWTSMGWGYWKFADAVPVVDRLKFIASGAGQRFLTNACDRWSKNYTNHLQAAWFNGDGFEAWENVWGTWNGITPRDSEAIRRVATLLRFFGGKALLLHSSQWEPHTPEALQEHVYASRWTADATDRASAALGLRSLWTVVNRAGRQTMRPIGGTSKAASAPAGMVHVPATKAYRFVTKGIEVEGDDQHGVDVQFPWEAHPQREHDHSMAVGPFYIGRHPVTNAEYAKYLGATGYKPADKSFWLQHWNDSATPPPSIANAPVVYVSLDEARRFCAWAGGRLPHAWEWQYAAQGTDGRLYPFGDNKTKSGALPVFHGGNANPGPPPVGQHSPAGDSPFGVADMVGTVWQYTSEFYDEHTRYVVLRGGSNYRPRGSNWYYPNDPELNTHQKYFLFSASYERAGTVGFRCVVDALK